jgi:hypothetical protein
MLLDTLKSALRWIVEHARLVLSLIAATVLIGYVLYLAHSDTRRKPITLEVEGASKTAFLELTEVETGSKKIKAFLQVPGFVPGEDKLEFASVTLGLDRKGRSRNRLISFESGVMPETNGPWFEFSLPYSSAPFYYPFESYDIDTYLEYKKCNSEEMPLKLLVINSIDELNIDSLRVGYSFEGYQTRSGAYSITLKRHSFVRAMAIIILLVALLYLLYNVAKEETSKVPANSLGFIAALWGIRQIIIGSVKLFPTIVDYTILALYLVVALIVLYKWRRSTASVAPARKYGYRPRPTTLRARSRNQRPTSSSERKDRWHFYE